MRCTVMVLGSVKTASQKTFGEVLSKNEIKNLRHAKSKPPGYDILESKFKDQIGELRQFLTEESKRQNSRFESKDDVINLIDKYVQYGTNTGDNSGNSKKKQSVLDKKLGIVQRKMIMAAYAKAGKKKGGNVKEIKDLGNKHGDRLKLALLMKRNWLLLEYVAKESGIEISKQGSEESWDFEEESESSENDQIQSTNGGQHNMTLPGLKQDVIDESSDFNSFLKKLNKVHQTAAVHVLPRMTEFAAHPTISHIHSNVDIADSEVKGIQDFLQDAKQLSESRDDLLFKAKTNYEWSRTLLSEEPRTLENHNFFTPVCVPNTLIPIHEYGLKKTIDAQEELKKSLSDLQLEKLDVLKIYADGSSGVLTNDNLTYWQGNVENLYTILSQLQHPKNFKSNLLKNLRMGWIPVSSEEREIVMVRDNWKYRLGIVKKGAILGTMGIFVTLGVVGFMGL